MKIEKRDGSNERRILVGLIVDPIVLGRVSAKWEWKSKESENGPFRNRWANLIAGWCVNHWRKYGKAPGKQIRPIYESWFAKNRDGESAKLIERFLGFLSDEYDSLAKESNSDYVIDLAASHFNEIKVRSLIDKIEDELSASKLDEAVKRIQTFDKVEIGVGAGIDILQDEEAIFQAFESMEDPLISLPGPVGKFVNGCLERDGFVAIMAPEKRGKCVSENVEVLLADGRLMTIGELCRSSDSVEMISLDEKSQRFVRSTVSEKYDNGMKECFRLTTRTGRQITTTENHPYLTSTGWRELKDLQSGDFVAVPKRIAFFGQEAMKWDELRFLAYMMADGGCSTTQANFTKTDPDIVRRFHRVCSNLGIDCHRVGITTRLRRCSADFRRRLGLWKVKSTTKRIPNCVFRCPQDQIAEFLRIFFSCDGYASSKGIGITLANRTMIDQLRHLLSRFGIVCRTSSKLAKCNGKSFPAWRLEIRDVENINAFLDRIGLLPSKIIARIRRSPKSFLDKFPWQIASNFLGELESEYGSREKLNEAFGSDRLGSIREQIAKRLPIMRSSFRGSSSPVHDKYMGSDILWDQVTSIESVGDQRTFDLTIEDHHNFIGNDCVVHNTQFLIEFAWRAMIQRKRVAFFEIGDMSQNQIMRRLMVRASGRPIKPQTIKYPISIRLTEDRFAEVEHDERRFKKGLDWRTAWQACRKVMKHRTRSKSSYFRLSIHPNDTINVIGIRDILERWRRQNWIPDVVVIDYADLLAKIPGEGEGRDQINSAWKKLRGLSESFHCLVMTATQSDADSYGAETLRRKHFSDDKRKHAHVTAMIGLNQTDAEKDIGVMRLNFLDLREQDFREYRCCHVAGCMAIGRPIVLSAF